MSQPNPEEYSSFAPRHQAALFGHVEAERALLDAWASGRLPHGWLITGPKGVGKATLAFRFARFLLTHGMADAADAGPSLFGDAPPKPTSLVVPEESPVYARVAAFGHADLITIEKSFDDKRDRWRSEIVIQDVRQLIERFALTAAEGGYRVCIVDAADDMNPNAANALLKVLEEPPPNAVLLLIAHAPGALLPTIRSRCRRLALQPLAASEMDQALGRLLPDLPPAERQSLGYLAEGIPGRAVALAAQGGLQSLQAMLELVATLPKADLVKLHSLGDRFSRKGQEQGFQLAAELFRWWLAQVVRSSALGRNGQMDRPELYAGEGALARKLAGWQAPARWAEDWEAIGRLLDRGESVNLDRKQMLLNIFAILSRAAEAGIRR